jgi:hypothetical protein
MSKRMTKRILIAMATALFAGPSLAADDAAVARDLTATITLLGLPCGQVVNVVRRGDNDYIAACKDKNRYRVFTNAEGRVVAQKQ